MNDNPAARSADKAALIVGVLLFVVAAVVWYDASQQTIVSTYGIGPTAMPQVVSIGLALLGIGHFVTAFRGGLPRPERADGQALLWIIVGQIGLIASVAFGLGFTLAITLVFACTARGFGRRAFAVDLAIGFVMGLGIFLIFAKLLTLLLPAGPLERLFL